MKKRILIIDDDEPLSQLTGSALEQSGLYEVRIENRPTLARKAAEEFMPDLILLDVIMPEIDGGTVASQLRERRLLKDIPIIFLTSVVGKKEAAAHEGTIGKEHFLAKPVTIAELLEAVRSTIA